MPASSPTPNTPPPARASWPVRPSTRGGPPSTSGGSRGPSSTKAPVRSSSGWRRPGPSHTPRRHLVLVTIDGRYRRRSSPERVWLAEQILAVGAHHLAAHRALPQPGLIHAPHHGYGHVAVLAHHQLGGRGQLVGDRHFG